MGNEFETTPLTPVGTVGMRYFDRNLTGTYNSQITADFNIGGALLNKGEKPQLVGSAGLGINFNLDNNNTITTSGTYFQGKGINGYRLGLDYTRQIGENFSFTGGVHAEQFNHKNNTPTTEVIANPVDNEVTTVETKVKDPMNLYGSLGLTVKPAQWVDISAGVDVGGAITPRTTTTTVETSHTETGDNYRSYYGDTKSSTVTDKNSKLFLRYTGGVGFNADKHNRVAFNVEIDPKDKKNNFYGVTYTYTLGK